MIPSPLLLEKMIKTMLTSLHTFDAMLITPDVNKFSTVLTSFTKQVQDAIMGLESLVKQL